MKAKPKRPLPQEGIEVLPSIKERLQAVRLRVTKLQQQHERDMRAVDDALEAITEDLAGESAHYNIP